MRPVHIRERDKGVVELAGRARRLRGEHVERRTDVPLANDLLERHVVHDFGARGVDEIRARLQPAEHRRVDHPAGLGGQREVDTEHIGARGRVLG